MVGDGTGAVGRPAAPSCSVPAVEMTQTTAVSSIYDNKDFPSICMNCLSVSIDSMTMVLESPRNAGRAPQTHRMSEATPQVVRDVVRALAGPQNEPETAVLISTASGVRTC